MINLKTSIICLCQKKKIQFNICWFFCCHIDTLSFVDIVCEVLNSCCSSLTSVTSPLNNQSPESPVLKLSPKSFTILSRLKLSDNSEPLMCMLLTHLSSCDWFIPATCVHILERERKRDRALLANMSAAPPPLPLSGRSFVRHQRPWAKRHEP